MKLCQTIALLPMIIYTIVLFLPFAASKDTGTWVKSYKAVGYGNSDFGNACSMNANILAIGAPYDTPNITQKDAGLVHIVNRDKKHIRTIEDFTGTKFDQLGESVAVSKGFANGKRENNIDVIVIGAPRHSLNENHSNVGMVKVFYYSNREQKWVQMGQDLLGRRSDEFFGEVVAISDDGLVIGVGMPVGDDLGRGKVEMYKYNDISGRWDLMGYPIEGHVEGARLGSSLSIAQKQKNDDNPEKYYVAVGAPQVSKGRGIVQVYNFDSDMGDWYQVGKNMDGDDVQDKLGSSISMAMNGAHLYLAIGIPSARYYGSAGKSQDDDDDNAGASDGRVQVYSYNTDLDTGVWQYFGDEIEQMFDGDGTGETVELSQDGMLLAIASPEYGDTSGLVRVYRFDASLGDYIRIGETLYGQAFEAFGTCLSFYGNDLAVGAPYGGYVQVFTYNSDLSSGNKATSASSGTFKNFITSSVVIVFICFLVFAAHKKLKNKGFRWSSFTAALPGAAAIRRRGREAVSTDEQRDEWPFPFFSASDRARIEEVRRAEEGRSHEDVDGVVLHGMPKSTTNPEAASSSGSDDDGDDDDDDEGSLNSKEGVTRGMRQIT